MIYCPVSLTNFKKLPLCLFIIVTLFFSVSCGSGGGGDGKKNGETPPPQPKLESPNNILASEGNGFVTLKWDAVESASSYTVYWSTNENVQNGSTLTGITETTKTIPNLTNNTEYYFAVIALKGDKKSSLSSTESATPKANASLLSAPENITTTSGDERVNISWDGVPNATSYSVYWSEDSGDGILGTEISGITGTNSEITNLDNGTTYFFVVEAHAGSGKSAASITVDGTPNAITSPPETPQNVDAVPGDQSITVTWAGVNQAENYALYWSTLETAGINGTEVSGIQGTSKTINALSNGTTYYVVVVATNSQGSSAPCSVVSATPQSNQAPLAPQNVVTTPGDELVNLSWDASLEATSYTVHWSDNQSLVMSDESQANITGVNSTVSGLTNDVTYYFAVIANKGTLASSPSTVTSSTPASSVLPPATPQNVQANSGNNSVSLSWTAVPNAISYTVYWSDDENDGTNGTAVSDITETTALIPGLTNGTSYYFVVTATSNGGEGDASSNIDAIPQLVLGDTITNTLDMTFVKIEPGTFTMGSPVTEVGNDGDEQPHTVSLTNTYYMMTTEVTIKQWKDVMGDIPEYLHNADCDDCPINRVSWWDARRFLAKLWEMDKTMSYRLPTEAEWEYAARAGRQTPFGITDSPCLLASDANYYGDSPMDTCPEGINRYETVPVGSLNVANAWGIYDMHGNVYEWCLDAEKNYSFTLDMDNPIYIGEINNSRVKRGGSYLSEAKNTRSANRAYDSYSKRVNTIGFRLVGSFETNAGLPDSLAAPQNLRVTPKDGTLLVSWEPVENALGYSLYWGETDTPLTNGKLAFNLKKTHHIIHNLENGTSYSFAVKAIDPIQEGTASNVVSVSPRERSTLGKPAINGYNMEFLKVPASTFFIGSPPDERGRSNYEELHRVTLTKPYCLMTTEVTQGQWKAIMGTNPSNYKTFGDDMPVESVSYEDITNFIVKLNQVANDGITYRLPTEAEWENAARAETYTPYSIIDGYCLSSDAVNFDGDQVYDGCPKRHYLERPMKVKKYDPNAWGFYEMHGNIGEIVKGGYYQYYQNLPEVDPVPAEPEYYWDSVVYKGGSYYHSAQTCRSAQRSTTRSDSQYSNVGFRLAYTADE